MYFPKQGQKLSPACRVKPCGRLVKNKHGGICRKHAGNCNAALLTAGKLERRFFKKLLTHSGKSCAAPNTFIGFLRAESAVFRRESNIAVNGFFKELMLGILKNNPDALSQLARGFRSAFKLLSVNQNFARRRINQPCRYLRRC